LWTTLATLSALSKLTTLTRRASLANLARLAALASGALLSSGTYSPAVTARTDDAIARLALQALRTDHPALARLARKAR
jgi:hypothetical protein